MSANGDNANSVNAQVNGSGPSTAAPQKTFVSVFHELCTKFGFGVAMYNLDSTTGEPHNKTFCISLTVNTLGITVQGTGMTKMKAKHDAAHKMMLEIRKRTREGESLNDVPKEKLLSCCEWMQKYESLNDDEPLQPTQPTNAAGVLTSWLLTRHRALPVYRVLKTTGPSHSRIYWMSCKLDHRVTEGNGKSKKVAKNIAAEKMLPILESEDYY